MLVAAVLECNYSGRLVECLRTVMSPPPSLRSPLLSVCPHSYSLEGLIAVQDEVRDPAIQRPRILEASRMPRRYGDDRGSLVSLTEEQEELGPHGKLHDLKSRRYRPLRNSCPPMTLPLTKSVSMLAISDPLFIILL
ncbi:uncharacterized protein ACO6RY_09953 [Pungitius sinensis]